MEDIPVYIAGLLGGVYVACSFAEFLLSIVERKSSAARGDTQKTNRQEDAAVITRFTEPARPDGV